VDRIVLRPLENGKDGKYVVVEGNRRAAALKTIDQYHTIGTFTLKQEIIDGIRQFEALIYRGKNPDIAWIIQGFRHTPGILSWDEYPKAKFFARLEREGRKNVNEIAHLFGINNVSDVSKLIRSYYGFEDAKKDEEYGEKLPKEKFGHFSKIIFGSASIQKWLEWDADKRKFKNKENLKEYLSWAIPKSEKEKPRIDISPRHRDALSALVKPENKKILERFENEEIDMEECRELLSKPEIKKERIAVPILIEQINDAKNLVDTLPIPRLQSAKEDEEKKEKDELLKALEELKKSLELQIKNLKRSR
jgi:hypothetical protein